jgi:hypothetical protein
MSLPHPAGKLNLSTAPSLHEMVHRQATHSGYTPVMYTYPAWTFGGKRKQSSESERRCTGDAPACANDAVSLHHPCLVVPVPCSSTPFMHGTLAALGPGPGGMAQPGTFSNVGPGFGPAPCTRSGKLMCGSRSLSVRVRCIMCSCFTGFNGILHTGTTWRQSKFKPKLKPPLLQRLPMAPCVPTAACRPRGSLARSAACLQPSWGRC